MRIFDAVGLRLESVICGFVALALLAAGCAGSSSAQDPTDVPAAPAVAAGPVIAVPPPGTYLYEVSGVEAAAPQDVPIARSGSGTFQIADTGTDRIVSDPVVSQDWMIVNGENREKMAVVFVDSGIVLERLVITAALQDRPRTTSCAPATPVILVPHRLTRGETWADHATCASGPDTITVDGTVGNIEAVQLGDGTTIQAVAIELNMTLNNPPLAAGSSQIRLWFDPASGLIVRRHLNLAVDYDVYRYEGSATETLHAITPQPS